MTKEERFISQVGNTLCGLNKFDKQSESIFLDIYRHMQFNGLKTLLVTITLLLILDIIC